MVTAKFSRWAIPLMLLVLTLFYGCGSIDGADRDDHIGVEIQAQDVGADDNSGTLTIDVVHGQCQTLSSNPDVDGPISPEPFGDTLGQVTFKYLGAEGVDTTYRFDSYTVAYIPLSSPDGEGGTFIPPDLQPLDGRILNTIALSRNFTEAQRTIILIPVNTKSEYVNKVRAAGRPWHSLYSLKVTFFGEKNRNEFTIESALDVTLGGYNRCPEGTVNIGAG